ncbi:carbohydrate kinase family protein [Streptomyces sp. 6N223]|uniref:carbohydrate kinase family protein n=1 Tax=Streptomyces sp. 6N223 TaxID=3457412 RepID=UPI003FD3906D
MPHEPRPDAGPDGGVDIDVFLSGLLYWDIGFTGLDTPPTSGAEVWSRGMGTSPGGIANFAVALARLGLRTSLAAAFGDDLTGAHCWRALAETEGVGLSRSRRLTDWPTPVTVSLAYHGDRALVTHGSPPPLTPDELIGKPPRSRAAIAHIGPEPQEWIRLAHEAGTRVFADVGWDPDERWSGAVLEQLRMCHAFMPNAEEAMAYTRTSSPPAALAKLSELVPLAVVTCGGDGVYAVDGTTGESARVPAVRAEAVDTTGAGDVFGAGLVAATLAGWPLVTRLRFASLVAALSVGRVSGAAAAPDWHRVARWWHAVRTAPGTGNAGLRRDFAFLDEAIPGHDPGAVLPERLPAGDQAAPPPGADHSER